MSETKKIIILEDDKASCQLLSAFLEKQGHQVLKSHESRFAIELALKEQPDLLIADVLLPDMHGSEAVKQLRGSQRGENLKVLFLTSLLGKKGGADKQLSLTLNGEEFPALAKPFRPEVLTAAVTSIFEEVDAERARIEAEKEALKAAKAKEAAKPPEEAASPEEKSEAS